ncbi:MAG: barstar family protein [Gammaproteobacteria bacterium]|nr:barstar family protein [Gammaproteobacteria bacterium]
MLDVYEPINGASIQDWESFHNEFQKKLGFFEGYGRNLDAWIDCMSDLYTNGEYESLTKYNLNEGDKLILNVLNVEVWREVSPDTFEAFIDCCVAANAERTNFYMVIK